MKPVEEFLRELAMSWTPPSRPTFHLLGSTALLLRTAHNRGTKDSDILETNELDAATQHWRSVKPAREDRAEPENPRYL